MSLLELKGVSRRFGAIEALKDISLSVEQGELRALIGPNGAGKTTLFNLVSGYFPPSDGSIRFDGADIGGISPSQLVSRGIVRTFQITEVFRDLTVYENLRVAVETAMGLTLRTFISRAQRRAIENRIEELLDTTGLTDRVDQVTGALALGDQRVVEMGITLTRDPKLLLLDEPTAGMGDEETQRMVGVIRALHSERGITMLFIEHDMSIIFGVADRITVLDNGHMMAEGTPDEIAENEKVQNAYLGRAQ